MKKNSLLSTVVILISFTLIIFLLQPLIATDADITIELEEKEKGLELSKSELAQAKKTQAFFQSMSDAEREKLKSQIPQGLNQTSVINELSSLAERNNASLISSTFSSLPAKDGVGRVSIVSNFSIAGDPKSIVSLLSDLENSRQLFTISSLSLLLNTARNDFSIRMEAYYTD